MIEGDDIDAFALRGDGREAEAQREATVMPWVWGAAGLMLIIAFVGWMRAARPSDPMSHVSSVPASAKPLRGGY